MKLHRFAYETTRKATQQEMIDSGFKFINRGFAPQGRSYYEYREVVFENITIAEALVHPVREVREQAEQMAKESK